MNEEANLAVLQAYERPFKWDINSKTIIDNNGDIVLECAIMSSHLKNVTECDRDERNLHINSFGLYLTDYFNSCTKPFPKNRSIEHLKEFWGK